MKSRSQQVNGNQDSSGTLGKQRNQPTLAEEMRELNRRKQAAQTHQQEKTFSGSVRRAIHSSKFLLPDLAFRLGVEAGVLADFLTGDRSLPSDAIDRLGEVLELRLELPKRWPIERIRIRRIYGTLTPAQTRELKKTRKLVEKELPDLIRRNKLAHIVEQEKTIGGALRRAIHTCQVLLPDLARRAEVDMADIADFLTGEKTLPSDAIDRLVKVLKLNVTARKRKPRSQKAKVN